jgi:electron transfer flavoprotein alpha subunit
MKIIAFSDNKAILSQIISRFRDEAEVHAVTPDPDFISKFGASKTFGLKGDVLSGPVSKAIEKMYQSGGCDLIAIGSTVTGREVAGMLSMMLSAQAVSEVNSLSFNGGKATTSRFFYGGKSLLTEESGAKIAVVAPGITEATESSKKSDISEIQLEPSSVKIVSRTDKKGGSVDIEKAQVIVSVGRGLGKKENLEKVEPFAKAVHGEIAGSRPVCLDYGWLSEDRQVGLSGKKVQPKLYIALGISGQIQHIAGMRNSKVVIAVNKDKSAPIFEEADYGIVGDLFDVIGKIKDKLAQ